MSTTLTAGTKAELPQAFGQSNTGAICYFNSLIQALFSCPQFVTAAVKNKEYLSRSKLGAEIHEFAVAAMAGKQPTNGTTRILTALIAELVARRPWFKLGFEQNSSSEALVFLIDMLESVPVAADVKVPAPLDVFTKLFLVKHRTTYVCTVCEKVLSDKIEDGTTLILFYVTDFDALEKQIGENVEYCRDPTFCRTCAKKTKFAVRRALSHLSEIVICQFNIYHSRDKVIDAPDVLKFNAVDKKVLIYRKVAQVEHSGGLNGGHYIARVLRRDGGVYSISDSAVSSAAASFPRVTNSYLVFYAYWGAISPEK